jgi:hypothetical protein
MAYLKSKELFGITSPRSPFKMVPEVQLLIEKFSGRPWNSKTQDEFAHLLSENSSFEGNGSQKDMAFSARDRINRGPKALGIVNLSPLIALTEPGKEFLDPDKREDILLRQLMKFQLPSPYHKPTDKSPETFWVRPYLEILRLVSHFGSLTFDEVKMFALQMNDYHKFDNIVAQIVQFRLEKESSTRGYKEFSGEYFDNIIQKIYSSEISAGETKTRESNDTSLRKFLDTKESNLRDYTDAIFRYLRGTQVVAISEVGHSISIQENKRGDVDYLLKNISRDPCFVDDEDKFKEYLFNSELPVLYSDDPDHLIEKLRDLGVDLAAYQNKSPTDLKVALKKLNERKKARILANEIAHLKTYSEFPDIMKTFEEIKKGSYYDTPLMLEWNTWRALTMIDGGQIKANMDFDDDGKPLSTAVGNMPDIECDYQDFGICVEVTMQVGQRQYESEGEPVARHLAKFKQKIGKPAYCIFVAPKINPASIAFFYSLYSAKISYYGGSSAIIPVDLSTFEEIVREANQNQAAANFQKLKKLCEDSINVANNSSDEMEWFNFISSESKNLWKNCGKTTPAA